MQIKIWNLLDGNKHTVAIVGAGGKTTVMYELAAYLSRKGKKVLVSTTTHIYKPPQAVFAENKKQLLSLWQQGSYAVCGRQAQAENKLMIPEAAVLQDYMQLADITLLEADGAKRKPCKVPAAHEPVILPQCDIVLGVLGLDTVGQKVGEACFRTELGQKLLNCDEEHVLTAEDMALIMTSPHGMRKNAAGRSFYPVLNKCDTKAAAMNAEIICRLLQKQGICQDDIWVRGAWQSE